MTNYRLVDEWFTKVEMGYYVPATAKTELERIIYSEILTQLDSYNKFLQKNGYTDSDIDLEEPTAIDRYIKGLK